MKLTTIVNSIITKLNSFTNKLGVPLGIATLDSGGKLPSTQLPLSGVIAGIYGDANNIPRITVDDKGRATSISTVTVNIPSGSLTFSGDVTGTGNTGSTTTLTLSSSGVTSGTYNNVSTQVRPFTVDTKGRITGIGTAVTITPAWSSITSKPTTLSGYGITDALSSSLLGAALGIPQLDANSKILLANLPDSILGKLDYIAVHNFSTGMPTATQKGQYWICSVAGNGYNVGDWAVYNGATFDKVDNTDAVSSVAGKTGVVTLVKADVGLANVDNTSDANKSVLSATRLTTPRTINGVAFDGTANITIVDSTKQPLLVSGENLKTINGLSLLGNGNITIDSGETVSINTTAFTATANQSIFNTVYTPQLVFVYVNGAKLLSSDFVATDGTSVTLMSGVPAGTLVEVVKFSPYRVIPTIVENINVILADKGTALVDSIDYMTPIEVPFEGTLVKVRARTYSGSTTVQFKRNGVNVGSALNVSSTGAELVVSQAVNAYDLMSVDLSNSSGNGLTISMEIQ